MNFDLRILYLAKLFNSYSSWEYYSLNFFLMNPTENELQKTKIETCQLIEIGIEH